MNAFVCANPCSTLSVSLAFFAGILHPMFAQTTLGIALGSNQVILSWPATSTNYFLQSATNLTSPDWVAANDANPVVVGNSINFTATSTSTARFFRLDRSFLVNVDYNYSVGVANWNNPPSHTPTMSGAAATGSSGDYWNGINTVSAPVTDASGSVVSGLMASDGQTLVPLTIALKNWTASSPGCSTPGNPILNLQNDYLVYLGNNQPQPQMVLGGLVPGNSYNIWLYAGNACSSYPNNSCGLDFQVIGLADDGTQSALGCFDTNLHAGEQYVNFTNVQADANGEITVLMTATDPYAGQYLGCFDGFQINGVNAAPTSTPVATSASPSAMESSYVSQLNSGSPPFSFLYKGANCPNGNWSLNTSTITLDTNRTQSTMVWSKPGEPLQVQCVAVQYSDYPAVEWTVWLTNSGTAATAMVDGLSGLDTVLSRANGTPEYLLNGINGSSDSFNPWDSFYPWQTTLTTNSQSFYAPPAGVGRPTWGAWPYWNLQYEGGSMILAVGWPGEWAASFARDGGTRLRIQAYQHLTHFYLNPGETVRTPLTVLLFWQGSDTTIVTAQNQWRNWYRAHVLPAYITTTHIAIGIGGSYAQMEASVNSYTNAGLYPDIAWRDAGPPDTWYSNSFSPYPYGPNDYLNTGSWDVNTNLWPPGQDFAAFSSAIKNIVTSSGPMQLLMWNEPERVGDTNYSWLAVNHPEWLLQPGSVGWILNEGNTNAFNWLTNHFTALIQSNGMGWYREDLNGNGPGATWALNDAPNRQGITENFYLQGHLAYLDALLKNNPGLKIDESGSGRADLETLRRAVALERTDVLGELSTVSSAGYARFADANQCQTMGLSSWLPFQGLSCQDTAQYDFRSFYGGLYTMNAGPSQSQEAFTEDAQVAPYALFGNYYPLTPYNQSSNSWVAWQFDLPNSGTGKNAGYIQAFSRTNGPTVTSILFQAMNTNGTYTVYRMSSTGTLAEQTTASGSYLMTNGVTLVGRGMLTAGTSLILYYIQQ